LIDLSRRNCVDDFRQAINQIFEFLMMIEKNLQTDSWMILIDLIFDKLYRNICDELIKTENKSEEMRDIFSHVLKKVYILLSGNQTKPDELLHKNYENLYSISKSQNKVILDLLMLSLNDFIVETIKLNENPWIDNLWEELIDYLSKLFHDYFPNEVL